MLGITLRHVVVGLFVNLKFVEVRRVYQLVWNALLLLVTEVAQILSRNKLVVDVVALYLVHRVYSLLLVALVEGHVRFGMRLAIYFGALCYFGSELFFVSA